VTRRVGRNTTPRVGHAAATVTLAAAALAACSTARLEDIAGRVEREAGRSEVQAARRLGTQMMPIGTEKEREIGFGIASTVAGRYGVVQDAELTRYVNLVGIAVAQQSPRFGEVDFHFGVLDTDDVNAFASPGGYVFVTRGALALMESEAELAAVLAHEVAHVDEKHVLDEIRRSSVIQQARDEAQIQGELLNQLADAGTTVVFTGLSREDEMESDSLGVMYAAATGYKAGGLLDFLTHLLVAEQSGSSGMREWLASHPSTDERIQALERQLAGRDLSAGAAGTERFRRRVAAGGNPGGS